MLLVIGLVLTGCITNEGPGEGSETVTQPIQDKSDGTLLAPLSYPETDVLTLEARNFTDKIFSARGAGETSYIGNGHYDGTNLVISPYFAAQIDEVALPVYATPVYVYTGSYGTLHSFASVDVQFGEKGYVTLTLQIGKAVNAQSAQVFSHDEVNYSLKDNTLTVQVYTHGVYTVVFNDSQDYALTVFVREYADEDAAIADYRAQYGENNVIVFEPGIHQIDYLNLSGDTVLYLKSGAILLPKHTFDIQDDDAMRNAEEENARNSNSIGLNRFPVVNTYAASNVHIAGRGTVDMTQLDWHERRGIVFTQCQNVSMDGVIIINPCEWAFITYRCENVTVTQSAVLGYRTNSDAFAICNTIGATVTDCFARTGDDMFEVKTLGGVDTAVSRDITYSRCQAWGSKARCFGVIGEIEKDVSNILFEDSIVIFRDAVWDNNRLGSLVVLRESGNGAVDGVTFRNIRIHYDAGRAINVGVYSDSLTNSQMSNIVFEDITYNSWLASQVRGNTGSGNSLLVQLRKVKANGQWLTQSNIGDYFIWDQEGLLFLQ